MTNPLIDKWNELHTEKNKEVVNESCADLLGKSKMITPTFGLNEDFINLFKRVEGGSVIVTSITTNINYNQRIYTIEMTDYV